LIYNCFGNTLVRSDWENQLWEKEVSLPWQIQLALGEMLLGFKYAGVVDSPAGVRLLIRWGGGMEVALL